MRYRAFDRVSRFSIPCRAVALGATLFLGLAVGAAPAASQALDANAWVTDGDVGVIVPWGETVYLGGNFGYVGPNTGGWAELDSRGRATTLLPRLDGAVTATVADGAGGWFLGGHFTHVAGLARPGLARVLANGSVAAWTPNPVPAGSVLGLEHQGTRVFVSTDAGMLRAYDDATGAAIGGWAPQVSGTVNSLAVNGTTLYAGGDLTFTITSNSATGSGIAAIHTGTGAVATWDPSPDAPVTRVQVEGRWLYVSGEFSTIGGQSHAGLARALLTTQAFEAGWSPSVDAPVVALASAPSGLWIAGGFFFVNGQFRDRLAVIDTTTGATSGLAPSITAVEGDVTALLANGPWMVLGVSPLFAFPLGGTAKPLVIRMDAADGHLDTRWRGLGEDSPTGDPGSVTQLHLGPAGVLAAGRFVSLGGRRQVAVAALDRATGIAREWDPLLAVDEAFPVVPSVSAIVPTGHAIYLGGYFTHAGGQLRGSLAAIDSANGLAQPWRADLGPVTSLAAGSAAALALYQDKLVVGGSFSSVGSQSRASLAQVDTLTGAPVAGWTCNVAGAVNCLLLRGATMFVGGGFSNAGGQARGHVAAIDPASGSVLPWNPGVEGVQVQAFAASGDTLYIAGDYSKAGGQNRLCLSSVSATSGALHAWAPAAFGPVRALVVDGPDLIAGGEFQFINGQPRPFLAWLNRSTGTAATGTAMVDEKVLSLARISGPLYVGGGFGSLAQSPTAWFGRIGGVDGAGPSVTVVVANGGEQLVVGSTYRFEYSAADPSGVASVDVELSRAGAGGPWALLAAGLRNTGHFDWLVVGPNVAGAAFLRVTARDFAGNLASDLSNAGFSIGAAVADVPPGAVGASTELTVGPNPARIGAELRFSPRQAGRARFRVLDVQGRVVWESPERWFTAGEHTLPCELRGVSPGLYFVRCERDHESRVARLVVVR